MANVIVLLADTPCTFTFRVEGFALAADVSLNSLGNLLNAVYNNDGCLIMSSVEPESFNSDLIMIESSLPQILANLLIASCSYTNKEFSELAACLEKYNPLKFNQSLGHKFYEYKLTKFLVSLYEKADIVLTLDYKIIPKYLIENTRLLFEDLEVSNVEVKGNNTISIKCTIRMELYI